jgi:ribosomal protein L17
MEPATVTAFLTAGTKAVELIKSVAELLPKGAKKDEIERKISEAANALALSQAAAAKELGYKLHRCTFPPQIMTYREADGGYWQCPACGHKDDDMPPMAMIEL